MAYFETKNLCVGYYGHVIIQGIDITLENGKILTLIGPNGAGKSTILKSITRQLAAIRGNVFFAGKEIGSWSPKAFAKQAAVVLTDRIRPELMTCAEVVAMGRYPHTNLFGRLTEADKLAVEKALRRVHALDLAQQDFATLSDGQRQRIMLARAICQEPQIIILDEPTAYLDIRYKVELLEILRSMAQEENITVIMSLHEIDLAVKVSDYLLCLKGDTVAGFGPPEEILEPHTIEGLYDIDRGSYNLLLGSVELAKPAGTPKAFVIAGGGCGVDCYRLLQKKGIPFATGILFQNDVDWQIAAALSDHVITVPAFEPMAEKHLDMAAEILLQCDYVIDAGTPIGTLNALNGRLLDMARLYRIPVYSLDSFKMVL